MAPRRGRGRAKMRARPPQVIRNSIAELANYDANVKAALQNNIDAARAYFPPLSKRVSASAIAPIPSESRLLQLHSAFTRHMSRSPAVIRMPPVSTHSALSAQLRTLATFFATPAATQRAHYARDKLWDTHACWIVPDVLPAELLPGELRQRQPPTKKARTAAVAHPPQLTSQQLLQNFTKQEADAQHRAQHPDVNQQHADEEQPELDAAVAEQPEDDEDMDHIADYQTGVHFDDDDGYEEVESGDDAEPVVAF